MQQNLQICSTYMYIYNYRNTRTNRVNLHKIDFISSVVRVLNPLKTGPKRVTGKQCRPRLDATERGVWSGSPLFANSSTIFLKNIYII